MKKLDTVIGIITLFNLLMVPLCIYTAIKYSSPFPLLTGALNAFVVFMNWDFLTCLFKKDHSNEINIR